jgi:AcrR family transcriptional regulator
MTSAERRKSILDAARRAFIETGDMTGTTIRHIAERGGISEGVIYRHFESKDQLYFEAVVEPLREAVDTITAAAADVVEREVAMTPERQHEELNRLYEQLIDTLVEILPLLGLVLFGDPKVAQRFYRDNFAVAMDRLAESWQLVGERYGRHLVSPELSARAIMGIALVLALESRHTKGFDRERAIEMISQRTATGFFEMKEPTGRRRRR